MKDRFTSADTWNFLLKEGWHYSPCMILFVFLEALSAALSGYAAVLLPSLIIANIENDISLFHLIIRLSIYFGILAILAILKEATENINMNKMIDFRTHYMSVMVLNCMNSDYETYEKEETQVMIEKGWEAIASNGHGVEGFYRHLVVLLTCAFELVIYSGLIGSLNISMVVIVIGLSLISYLIKDRFNRKYETECQKRAENDVYIRYFSELPYDIASGKDIRLYQMQEMLKEKFKLYNSKIRETTNQIEKYICNSSLVTAGVTFMKDIICYGFLIQTMTDGNMSVSKFVLYLGSFTAFSERFVKMSDQLSLIAIDIHVTNDFRKILNVLHSENGKETVSENELDIQFDHVFFRYNEGERWILDDFSLHIHPHEKVALVGVNGAGKTTIVKLLCRLLHPVKGRILINGKDLETLNYDEYREKVGCVFQDTKPFDFTIGTNVSGKLEGQYDDKKVQECLEKAGLGNKTVNMKDGVHTWIGNTMEGKGILLSGGEIQKLMLARAYYHSPSFMILDEPTAALDAISEQEMYDSYLSFIQDHNALFISHRLASTRFCDRIVFLENGKIAEEGTHEQLMEKQGKYKEMFEIQAKYYRKGEQIHEEVIS